MNPRLRLVVPLVVCAAFVSGCSGSSDDDAQHEPTASSSAASVDASSVGTLVQAGLRQLNSGNESSARTTFENALTLDPHNLYAHYNLGLIDQQSGSTSEAIKQYDAALEANDAFAPALYNRAILTESTDLGQAVSLYRRAVGADPTFAAAFMRLGFALVHLGDIKEGQKYLGKGVSLDPSMANVDAPTYA